VVEVGGGEGLRVGRRGGSGSCRGVLASVGNGSGGGRVSRFVRIRKNRGSLGKKENKPFGRRRERNAVGEERNLRNAIPVLGHLPRGNPGENF